MFIQSVRGMNDILPDEAPLWEFFEEIAQTWLKSYGYRNIRFPLVEHTDLFARAIGEGTDIVEKEMYSFVDELNGERLSLRPEGTASCVRAAVQHNLLYPGSLRLYYSGPMFRHERPQKGRYRQFHQIGVEALGFTGPDIDAEHILMCARLWGELGLSDIKLQVNSLGDIEERRRYRQHLVDYLASQNLDADSRNRLHKNPLRILDSKNPEMKEVILAAPKLFDFLGEASLKHFEEWQAFLKEAGIVYEINPKLVRGLDYYNRSVFEWITDKLGAQGTICAGGRYDGLIEQIGGKPAPACGFAIGIERVIALMRDMRDITSQTQFFAPDVYVVHQGTLATPFAFTVAETLRDQGLEVIFHCGSGNFKSQMRKADQSGASVAVIIGDDEAQAGQASVKQLRIESEQKRYSLSDLPIEVMNLISSKPARTEKMEIVRE